MEDEALLDTAVVSLTRLGHSVQTRVPGTVVMVAPKVALPVGFFILLTVITLGAFLLIWIPLATMVPRIFRTTLTVQDGAVVRSRKWSYV